MVLVCVFFASVMTERQSSASRTKPMTPENQNVPVCGLAVAICSRFRGSVKCKRPRMTDHRGRTWDQCDVIDAQGVKLTGYLDTTWGHFFYFFTGTEWPKASIDRFMQGRDNTADFRCAN